MRNKILGLLVLVLVLSGALAIYLLNNEQNPDRSVTQTEQDALNPSALVNPSASQGTANFVINITTGETTDSLLSSASISGLIHYRADSTSDLSLSGRVDADGVTYNFSDLSLLSFNDKKFLTIDDLNLSMPSLAAPVNLDSISDKWYLYTPTSAGQSLPLLPTQLGSLFDAENLGALANDVGELQTLSGAQKWVGKLTLDDDPQSEDVNLQKYRFSGLDALETAQLLTRLGLLKNNSESLSSNLLTLQNQLSAMDLAGEVWVNADDETVSRITLSGINADDDALTMSATIDFSELQDKEPLTEPVQADPSDELFSALRNSSAVQTIQNMEQGSELTTSTDDAPLDDLLR